MSTVLAVPLIIASVATVLTIELLFRLPWTRFFIELLSKFSNAIEAFTADHMTGQDQEIALRKAALGLLIHTSIGMCFLSLILAMAYGLEIWLQNHYDVSLADWSFIIILTLTGLVYMWMRPKLGVCPDPESDEESDQTYSPVSKALHRFALENVSVSKFIHAFERRVFLKGNTDTNIHRPIWVSGLARGGTTLVTDLIYQTRVCHALTYRDMPFVLAPNGWRFFNRFNRLRGAQKVARAHGDGMMIGLDSPEAFEEIFWRMQTPKHFSDPTKLSRQDVSLEAMDQFKDYLTLVMQSRGCQDRGEPRYLAKNNNHIMRLSSLLEHFPTGYAVIPIREPLAHANSLLKQHQRWVQRHHQDPFALDYMKWLGHLEFGSAHVPFAFSEDEIEGDPNTLEYWVCRWIDAYDHLSKIESNRVHWVDYQRLTSEPSHVLTRLFKDLDLQIATHDLEKICATVNPERPLSLPLPPSYKKAQALYQEIRKRSC